MYVPFHISVPLIQIVECDFSLSNLFNALPRNSPLRLQVYNALIRLAVTQDDVEVLQISDSAVDRWLSEWDISDDEKSEFLLSISDAYEQGGNL